MDPEEPTTYSVDAGAGDFGRRYRGELDEVFCPLLMYACELIFRAVEEKIMMPVRKDARIAATMTSRTEFLRILIDMIIHTHYYHTLRFHPDPVRLSESDRKRLIHY